MHFSTILLAITISSGFLEWLWTPPAIHILLVRPPASAKTMFLTSLMHHVKDTTRTTHIQTSVFATSNDARKISAPLQSRFFIVKLEAYTYEQFC
ncbi:MAG: hypothetical protein WAJ93_06755, partial [Candidatus Nitrosopolaris sp.]